MSIETAAAALKMQGMSIRNIAKRLSVSPSAVFRALKAETVSRDTKQKRTDLFQNSEKPLNNQSQINTTKELSKIKHINLSEPRDDSRGWTRWL